jgi:hypothetical protein
MRLRGDLVDHHRNPARHSARGLGRCRADAPWSTASACAMAGIVAKHDFTPWLSTEENIAQLARAHVWSCGSGDEVPVGPFSADILANDPSENFVVIEKSVRKDKPRSPRKDPHLRRDARGDSGRMACRALHPANIARPSSG